MGEAVSALQDAVETLIRAGGGTPPPTRDLFRKREDQLQDHEKEAIRELYEAAEKGFFRLAATGRPLAPVDRIRDELGATLEQNYPDGSAAFLKFATTYWTFKLVIGDVVRSAISDVAEDRPSDLDLVITVLARELELHIGALFFPTPGAGIPAQVREKAQREVLVQLAPVGMEIEDFILVNPILNRDRGAQAHTRQQTFDAAARQRSGCLLGLLALIGLVIVGALML